MMNMNYNNAQIREIVTTSSSNNNKRPEDRRGNSEEAIFRLYWPVHSDVHQLPRQGKSVGCCEVDRGKLQSFAYRYGVYFLGISLDLSGLSDSDGVACRSFRRSCHHIRYARTLVRCWNVDRGCYQLWFVVCFAPGAWRRRVRELPRRRQDHP